MAVIVSQTPPPLVPTVHHLVETLKTAHAKHKALHRAHHHLAQQIAQLRRDAVAAGKVPNMTPAPSGAAGAEGLRPPSSP